MKRSQILAKLDTYKTLREQNLVSPEILAQSIQTSLEEGALKKLPLSAFEKENTSHLLEFAKEFGLVKVKGQGKQRGGNRSGGSASEVLEAYPDVAPAINAINAIKGMVFTLTDKSGSEYNVVFQPFWRTVKPKTATTEGEVEL